MSRACPSSWLGTILCFCADGSYAYPTIKIINLELTFQSSTGNNWFFSIFYKGDKIFTKYWTKKLSQDVITKHVCKVFSFQLQYFDCKNFCEILKFYNWIMRIKQILSFVKLFKFLQGEGHLRNDFFQISPFRSNLDGTCRSWCDGGAYHRRYRDLQDACGVCLFKIKQYFML